MTPDVEAVLKTLPRRIKVGPYDWRIKIETGESDDYGVTDLEKYQISIWPEVFPSAEFAVGTVLHELLHVIYSTGGSLEGADEETTVSGFETGLISLFRDNPKLLNWIKRGLKKSP